MISRLDRFIRAMHALLFTSAVCIILAIPAPAAPLPQDQAPGELTLPTATAETQAGGQPAGENPLATAAAAGMEQPGMYTVVEGDTLWDISNAHYRDPFLWPLIWKANPAIVDPDLIYPGNRLVIPSLAPIEQAMSAPEEAAPAEAADEEQTPPPPPPPPPPTVEREGVPSFFRQKRIEAIGPAEPEETVARLELPEDTRPTIIDKYAILSGGFVSDEPSDDKIITHTTDPEKSILAYDDVVYISIKSRQDVNVGDLFLIYRPMHSVRHPINRRYFGKLNRVMGILKVIEVREKGPHVARITRSFDAAQPGSLLSPYQKPEPLYANQEKREKDISGHLLEVTDRRTINADVDIVYLDKGKIDGVEPGDRFLVIADKKVDMHGILRSRKMPDIRGEVQVFLVKERTATAIVKKSTNVLSRGNRVQYKN